MQKDQARTSPSMEASKSTHSERVLNRIHSLGVTISHLEDFIDRLVTPVPCGVKDSEPDARLTPTLEQVLDEIPESMDCYQSRIEAVIKRLEQGLL